MTRGKLYLVGAGPGAADLLTVRAAELLRRADAVLYDRLVSQEILDLIPSSVERIFVGKISGRDPDATQSTIHRLMVALAGGGRTVVRLKGGDPCVFARGGEELLYAAEAGFEVEFVPGISSCISAPALAGIPVTMRGVSSAFAVFSGKAADREVATAGIDWKLAVAVPTAVFLMGAAQLPQIARKLVENGRAPETPVAVIEAASRNEQRTVVGTLETIAQLAKSVRPPATIVVGEVVRLRERVTSAHEQSLTGGERSAHAVEPTSPHEGAILNQQAKLARQA